MTIKLSAKQLRNIITETVQSQGWVVRTGPDSWLDDDGQETYDKANAVVFARREGAEYEAQTGDYEDAVVEPALPGYRPVREVSLRESKNQIADLINNVFEFLAGELPSDQEIASALMSTQQQMGLQMKFSPSQMKEICNMRKIK